MIATGTDIKPLECVLFMRDGQVSRTFFEQMKGRGVRVICRDRFAGRHARRQGQDHFVIVDAVGVCERDKTDSRPMDQKKSVSFEKLLQAVALGNTEPEVLSSVAARLARLDKSLSEGDKAKVAQASGGASLKNLAHGIVAALNPDESPNSASLLVLQAVKPLCDPKLRNLLIELKKQTEQIIDTVTQDQVLEAGFSAAARERAKGVVESFERFIAEHKDEITALQILYSRPQRTQGAPLTFEALKNLADALQAPPRLWTESQLWQAYAALDKSKVKGESRRRILTDLVSLVRFAMHQDNELVPFPERVNVNFKAWLVGASSAREKPFTEDQIKWLTMIRDHIAANLGIETDDFELSPFAQEGGIGKVHQLFGAELPRVLIAINQALVA